LLSAAFGVGFVLGPAIGGLAALGGPREPFFVAGSIALINAVAAIKRLPETSTAQPRAADARAPRIREGRRRQLLQLAAIGFIATSAFSIFEATFALFAERRFSLGSAGVAAVFVGIGLGLVAVQGGAIRPVTDAIGAVGALRAGLMINVAGLLMLAASKQWVVLVPALMLLVAGQGLAAPSLTATVARASDPSRRGEALGFQQGVSAVARVVGPAMGGALLQHAGVPVPYVVGAGMVFGAAALAFTFVG
jgi:DHA1 family tetracycline resistance protein-like MFS transporter